MEVDLERGTKRSCREAELPESASAAQGSPGALFVDAEGEAIALQDAGAVDAAQCSGTPEGGQTDTVPSEGASSPQGTVSVGQPSGAQLDAPAAAAAGTIEGTVQRGSHSNSEKADEAAREASKASFARLVTTTCSQRIYPY